MVVEHRRFHIALQLLDLLEQLIAHLANGRRRVHGGIRASHLRGVGADLGVVAEAHSGCQRVGGRVITLNVGVGRVRRGKRVGQPLVIGIGRFGFLQRGLQHRHVGIDVEDHVDEVFAVANHGDGLEGIAWNCHGMIPLSQRDSRKAA